MLRLFIILNLLTLSVHGTTFIPQPIEQQIREAEGVFQGNFLRSKSVELEDGKVATQYVFKMTRESGLGSELFGMDEVIVHFPGGKVGDKHVQVEGVPKFVPGEKVVVFIKSVDNRYWGMNLGFGTFKVVNYGKEVILFNTIYPHNPQIGQVNLRYFEQALKDIKGTRFKTVSAPLPSKEDAPVTIQRMPASVDSKRQNRSIASETEESENTPNRPNSNVFWLMVMLGLLGGIFRINRNNSSK